jgi:PhnB protein
MSTEITVMLAVRDPRAALAFYQSAFGAELLWSLGGDDHTVAGLQIGEARFFLATESPEFGTRAPADSTTVRIELFVDDPHAVQARAVAAGATERNPVQEHEHETRGPRPIRRMLQGSVRDPSGHIWLIGKFLD